VQIDGTLPVQLMGDQDRLRQVLLNLLNNAIKFTPQGRVVLAVQQRTASEAGVTLRFSVSDTGIGIPKDKQDRLFQMFSQVDGSIRREFGGTGLGLAISQHLVQHMGGEICVESELGRGSVFWFEVTLPRAELGALPAASSGQIAASTRAARILLVEDTEINQEIARSMLESAGHQVEIVSDGSAAVMRVRAETYDLVLMDVQMPVMDGMTATRHIRALNHPACDVPIVAMTANVLPQQVRSFRDAGMNDHIGKPFRRDELYAAIERWVGAPALTSDEPAAVGQD
jgi:CheY-like chemotaxis protein